MIISSIPEQNQAAKLLWAVSSGGPGCLCIIGHYVGSFVPRRSGATLL